MSKNQVWPLPFCNFCNSLKHWILVVATFLNLALWTGQKYCHFPLKKKVKKCTTTFFGQKQYKIGLERVQSNLLQNWLQEKDPLNLEGYKMKISVLGNYFYNIFFYFEI